MTKDIQDLGHLRCPRCQEEYNHFNGGPFLIKGMDAYKAGWYGRGDRIVVPIEGECGHRWELSLGFHKGAIYVFSEVLSDEPRETSELGIFEPFDLAKAIWDGIQFPDQDTMLYHMQLVRQSLKHTEPDEIAVLDAQIKTARADQDAAGKVFALADDLKALTNAIAAGEDPSPAITALFEKMPQLEAVLRSAFDPLKDRVQAELDKTARRP